MNNKNGLREESANERESGKETRGEKERNKKEEKRAKCERLGRGAEDKLSPHAPWAHSPKVVKTNEIVRLVIII